jgi:hypothetical protein
MFPLLDDGAGGIPLVFVELLVVLVELRVVFVELLATLMGRVVPEPPID